MSSRTVKSFLFCSTSSAVIVAALSVTMGLKFGARCSAAFGDRHLISEQHARQLGLQRAWTGQVRVNPARNHVERAVLEGDRLTVLTTAGVVQEFNALTGETLWVAPIGNPDHPSLGPAASDKHVAIVNGSTLFVLDRNDGKPVVVRPVGGAPGAAPALGANYVFVPIATGRIEGYPLGEQKLTPWYYQSYGRAMVKPLATPESFVWTTDSGHMYVGSSDELGVRFRLETGSEIVAPPAYGAPSVVAATSRGEVFAMHEMTGQRLWKYAAGFPVTRAPAVVGNRVFVTSEEPMLHCIDAKTGDGLWETPHVSQFAAANDERVYGVDDLGALVVLDAATGALLGRLPTATEMNALVNDQTDRVYLVSNDGVVQCFHEIGAEKPTYHQPKPRKEGSQTQSGQSQSPPSETPRTQPEKPVDTPAENAEGDPFGGVDATDNEPTSTEDASSEDAEAGSDDDPFSGMGFN